MGDNACKSHKLAQAYILFTVAQIWHEETKLLYHTINPTGASIAPAQVWVFTQMTLRQNVDATPGTDWTIVF